MQDNVSLREATPDDQEFLLEVYASTRIDELAETGWDAAQKRAFIQMQFMIRERSYPRVGNQIILLNGRAIGRMLIDRGSEETVLRDIALLTEYRNAGVGSQLIRDLMKEATESGKPIMLHVISFSPAVRLYERLGFRQTGEEAAYLEMRWFPAAS